MFQEKTQVIKTSEYCSENTILYVDVGNLIPIIAAASGICLIVLITLIVVCYCKVVKKKEKTEKEEEVKHENPVYNAWVYDVADDNYVKDVNNCYDQ